MEGVEETESLSAGLSASVPIYSGNRLESAIKSAELGIDISKLEFSQAQDDLIYQVVTAYVNALENLATSRVDLETERNLSEHEKMIAAQYDAGGRPLSRNIRSRADEFGDAHVDGFNRELDG